MAKSTEDRILDKIDELQENVNELKVTVAVLIERGDSAKEKGWKRDGSLAGAGGLLGAGIASFLQVWLNSK